MKPFVQQDSEQIKGMRACVMTVFIMKQEESVYRYTGELHHIRNQM